MLTKLKHLLICPKFKYYKSLYMGIPSTKSESKFRKCANCGIVQEKVVVQRPVPFTNSDDSIGIMGLWYHWKDIQ